MGSVSDGVSMRGAGAGSRGWRAGPVGDARAALRRSKARRAVSRAPRRWVENEKTSVPGALEIIVACVSTPRAAYRPTADDRRRAIARARRIHRRAKQGHGAHESNRRRATRSRRWVRGWARRIK